VQSTADNGAAVDDIVEAVFRHMFHKNASAAQQTAGVYCLEVRGADATPGLLARLHDVFIPVRKASDCSAGANGVFEKATHKRGLKFDVEQVQWDGADGATASGGYYEAGESASGNTFTLERKAGKWRLVKEVMNWIS